MTIKEETALLSAALPFFDETQAPQTSRYGSTNDNESAIDDFVERSRDFDEPVVIHQDRTILLVLLVYPLVLHNAVVIVEDQKVGPRIAIGFCLLLLTALLAWSVAYVVMFEVSADFDKISFTGVFGKRVIPTNSILSIYIEHYQEYEDRKTVRKEKINFLLIDGTTHEVSHREGFYAKLIEFLTKRFPNRVEQGDRPEDFHESNYMTNFKKRDHQHGDEDLWLYYSSLHGAALPENGRRILFHALFFGACHLASNVIILATSFNDIGDSESVGILSIVLAVEGLLGLQLNVYTLLIRYSTLTGTPRGELKLPKMNVPILICQLVTCGAFFNVFYLFAYWDEWTAHWLTPFVVAVSIAAVLFAILMVLYVQALRKVATLKQEVESKLETSMAQRDGDHAKVGDSYDLVM